MARLLDLIVEDPRPCSYLDDREASLEHRIMVDVEEHELQSLLEHGWRRFGPDYFRPKCAGCIECIPTRIPVALFAPSKSQRRARKKCAGLRIQLGSPRLDEERLALYRAWHSSREAARGWRPADLDERSYRIQFTFPNPASREITYRDPESGKLVGVGFCDQTARAWSAIYFFYDPEWASRSIGTANVVFQVEIARALSIPYVYLGYFVRGCPSLAYKGSFRPQEKLIGLPDDDEAPTWVPVTAPDLEPEE